MCKAKKLCPRCGLEGSGPYVRYVLNSAKKKYQPYAYFCHKIMVRLNGVILGSYLTMLRMGTVPIGVLIV
jgi:hypothetical protein